MKKILIVGLGLLGGSYAKGLKAKGHHLSAIDPNQDSIDFALAEKIIDEGSISPQEALISQAEVIIFALYPSMMLDWVEKQKVFFQPGTIITDVCGVKQELVEGMEKILPSEVYFVGAHPMAGKEVSGIRHSDPKMFQNANFILTPTSNTNENALATVRLLAEELEFARISVLDPLEHDKAIGFLSQLTHVIAVSLMNCQNNEEYIKYTGDSFRDLTRIAKINEHLWTELFLANKDILLEEIDQFSTELHAFREILASEDVDAMKKRFINSTERRKKYE